MDAPLRILHLEDNPVDSEMAEAILHAEGILCEFERVETEIDFLSALERGEFDLILADYNLPTFDGISALSLALNRGSEAPFIFISGRVGEDLAVETLKLGATDYVAKDRLWRLPLVLRRALREKEEQRARERIETELRYRLEHGNLIASISTHFINLETEEIPHGIDEALRKIGEFTRVDRSYIFEFSDNGERMTNTFEWCAPGIEPQMENRTNLSVEAFRELIAQLKRKEPVLVRVADLPEDGGLLREITLRDGVKSFICLPIVIGNSLIGFVGLGTIREERTWSDDTITLLRIVGEIFANALKRKHAALVEEQLGHLAKMEAIGQLAAGVAHDFNNLLMVIQGSCEILFMKTGSEDPMRDNIAEIEKSVERGASLTAQLLAFSRKQKVEPRLVNLNASLSGMEKMLRRLIGANIALLLELAKDTGVVKVDPGQMEQVIMNLAVNARDAMPQGGRLIISSANAELDQEYASFHANVTAGSYVVLAVGDTGTGMDEKTRARIFEPFFTTKAVGRGTGLGLATVYGIVKQAGGHIFVYSEVGFGTTFKVYLPRVDQPADLLSMAASSSRLRPGTETILMVDDNDSVRTALGSLLEMHGYTVLQASGGPEALEIAARTSGDIRLLITDMVMPQMSGLELSDKFMASRPGSQVILMTGYSKEAINQHETMDRKITLIEKPVSVNVLLDKIRELLGLASQKEHHPQFSS